jgi:hypothetical protein
MNPVRQSQFAVDSQVPAAMSEAFDGIETL